MRKTQESNRAMYIGDRPQCINIVNAIRQCEDRGMGNTACQRSNSFSVSVALCFLGLCWGFGHTTFPKRMPSSYEDVNIFLYPTPPSTCHMKRTFSLTAQIQELGLPQKLQLTEKVLKLELRLMIIFKYLVPLSVTYVK
uniref:Uncharacterized protein n=1 Tax=Rhodosorus marinus TaxID=101924 RepID=A0A7S3ELX1_9RHOD